MNPPAPALDRKTTSGARPHQGTTTTTTTTGAPTMAQQSFHRPTGTTITRTEDIMNNDIQPTTHIQTTVAQRFEGITHSVPEWPGYTHKGKPVVITRVTISHRVSEKHVSGPDVSITAYVLKKDGTLSAQAMDTMYALSSFGPTKVLREELIAEYGADVQAEAERIHAKLYA